jgi:hypothetical protein
MNPPSPNRRAWTLAAAALFLTGAYVFAFTDWLAPQPIEIASQIRPVIQPPRFGRRGPKGPTPGSGKPIETEPGGGVARVTFSLDGRYRLTSVRVFALNDQGEPAKKVWDLTGKSRELNSLMYGMNPAGMVTAEGTEAAAPLESNLSYLLEIRAGRRSGSHRFRTTTLTPTEN